MSKENEIKKGNRGSIAMKIVAFNHIVIAIMLIFSGISDKNSNMAKDETGTYFITTTDNAETEDNNIVEHAFLVRTPTKMDVDKKPIEQECE